MAFCRLKIIYRVDSKGDKESTNGKLMWILQTFHNGKDNPLQG